MVVVGGKGERKGGREKGERRELKLGWWRRGEKGMVLGGVLASASIYMFHKDESKCDMGVNLHRFRLTSRYQTGWRRFKMAPSSPGCKCKCIYK